MYALLFKVFPFKRQVSKYPSDFTTLIELDVHQMIKFPQKKERVKCANKCKRHLTCSYLEGSPLTCQARRRKAKFLKLNKKMNTDHRVDAGRVGKNTEASGKREGSTEK